MLKPLVTKETGYPEATGSGSKLLLSWAGAGTHSSPKGEARGPTLPLAAHAGGKGSLGQLWEKTASALHPL